MNRFKISLAAVDVPLKALLSVLNCFYTKRIGVGRYVDIFEREYADYIGSKYALMTCNGTVANMIMLMTLKELYPGKTEVILPALTFVAHPNSVVLAGLKPVFVDVGPDMQIDPKKVKITKKTLCVFPVHLMGFPSMTDFKAPVLEDCCEAMGGSVGGKKFGTMGIAGSFSMFPSHTVTVGEGGIITTNDSKFYEIAKSIRNHGKTDEDFNFGRVGINGKISNILAAVGCSLIDKIDDINRKRVENFKAMGGTDSLVNSPHCFPFLYESKTRRDYKLAELKFEGIEARKLMNCIPDLPFYNSKKCPVARLLADTGLYVPIHQFITKDQLKFVKRILCR